MSSNNRVTSFTACKANKAGTIDVDEKRSPPKAAFSAAKMEKACAQWEARVDPKNKHAAVWWSNQNVSSRNDKEREAKASCGRL